MANREWGAEAQGGDDDGDAAPAKERKVDIENAYFERLKKRMAFGVRPRSATQSVNFGVGLTEQEKSTGPVIYNDDGSVYRKPG